MVSSNPPIQVLMTADTVGGVWTYAMELCAALAHRAFFHLVTLGAPLQPWQQQELNHLSNVKVYPTTYKLEWMEDPWDDLDASSKFIQKLADDIRPHIIHLNCYAYGALSLNCPVLMVAHSDVFTWWQAVLDSQPPHSLQRYFSTVQAGINGASHLVAPSAAMLSAFNAVYRCSQPQSVIYNARQTTLWYSATKQPVVMSMGRLWDEAKNMQLLAQAAPDIACPVIIAGDNHFDNNELEIAPGKLHYLGKLNTAQIAHQLSSAAIYAMPARYEPFGLSILEAALSGCALVLSDIPSLREIWNDAAIFLPTNAPANWVCAINNLLRQPQYLQQMGQKAYAQAQQYHTPKFASAYYNLYQQLISA